MVDVGRVRCRFRDRPTAHRARGVRGPCRRGGDRAGAGPGGGLERGGDDLGAEARDRQAAPGAVRKVLRASRPADRPARAATRGAGDGRCRGRGPGCRRIQEDLDRARLRAPPPVAQAVPRAPAARARRDRGAGRLRLLRLGTHREARRGRHRDAGGDPAPVEGDPDGAREVHLPGLREDQPAAGAVPSDAAGLGRAEPAGDDPVREVRPASAAQPAGRALCPRGRRAQPLHAGRPGGRQRGRARSPCTR